MSRRVFILIGIGAVGAALALTMVLVWRSPKAGTARVGGDAALAPESEGRQLPTGYSVALSSGSGRLLVAQGLKAPSARVLLTDAMIELGTYFDQPAHLVGGFMDQQDTEAQGMFVAQFHGVPVRGVALVGVGQGQGVVSVVYDLPESPPRTLPVLLKSARDLLPAPAAPAPPAVNWVTVLLPDGSAGLRLPQDWRITSAAAKGAMSAAGPQGQTADFGQACPVNLPEAEQARVAQQMRIGAEPRPSGLPVARYGDAVQALQDLTPQLSRAAAALGRPQIMLARIVEQKAVDYPNGRAAFVLWDYDKAQDRRVGPGRALSLVIVMPTSGQQWLYYRSTVAAPAERFAQDLPTLLQIWGSYTLSEPLLHQRLSQALMDMPETSRLINAGFERKPAPGGAGADWDQVLRDPPTDPGWVREMVDGVNAQAGYVRYKEIPLHEQAAP